jgi:hypothetical protein
MRSKRQKTIFIPGLLPEDIGALLAALRIADKIVRKAQFFPENISETLSPVDVELLTPEQIARVRQQLQNARKVGEHVLALRQGERALRGDSNDEEHEALYAIVDAFGGRVP